MERRSHVEITAEILRIAKKGVRKTQIVYGANLNFKMLKEYIERLERRGLVKVDRGMVQTTDRGKQFLEQFNGLGQFGIVTVPTRGAVTR